MEALYRKYEEQKLHESIYEEISDDWAQKRSKPWNELEIELQKNIDKKYHICLDAGCGTGRNVPILLKHADRLICLDISIQQVSLLKENFLYQKSDGREVQMNEDNENKINPIVGDIMHPPFRPCSVDLIASVSTIHHIPRRSNRIDCLIKLMDIICDDGGLMFYTVWRFDIPRFKAWFEWQTLMFSSGSLQDRPKLLKEPIEYGDVIVPWTVSKINKTFLRFYHLFTEKSLAQELEMITQWLKIEIHSFPEEKKDNFLIFIKKQSKEF